MPLIGLSKIDISCVRTLNKKYAVTLSYQSRTLKAQWTVRMPLYAIRPLWSARYLGRSYSVVLEMGAVESRGWMSQSFEYNIRWHFNCFLQIQYIDIVYIYLTTESGWFYEAFVWDLSKPRCIRDTIIDDAPLVYHWLKKSLNSRVWPIRAVADSASSYRFIFPILRFRWTRISNFRGLGRLRCPLVTDRHAFYQQGTKNVILEDVFSFIAEESFILRYRWWKECKLFWEIFVVTLVKPAGRTCYGHFYISL